MLSIFNPQLHPAQASVLKTLRRSESVRFRDMRLPTELESDVFKFHLRKLIKLGYIQKLPAGSYQLTASGKQVANSLDEQTRTQQKQSKLSLIMVARKRSEDGRELFLLQQRFRNPFWGYWGLISGPAHWGVSFEETAAAEFYKQTGLSADFEVRSFCRQRDYDKTSGDLLEDKLFAVLETVRYEGQLGSREWLGGSSSLMSLDELTVQPRYFSLTSKVIGLLKSGQTCASFEESYSSGDY